MIQRGVWVRTGGALTAARPGAQSAVGVAAQALRLRPALEKPLRTARHTQALVEEVLFFTIYTHAHTHSVQSEPEQRNSGR